MIRRADSSQTQPNVMYDEQQIEQAPAHSEAVFRGYLPHDDSDIELNPCVTHCSAATIIWT